MKISCLMVTRDRLALAKRAIRSYADQTYTNRELVIVTDGAPSFRIALQEHAAAIGTGAVRIIEPEQCDSTLGALRNLALDAATGHIVCQWDDDDCSLPERLAVQCAHMLERNAHASFMTEHLHYIADEGMLCWIDWTVGQSPGPTRVHPGTLMMIRDPRFRYPDRGSRARRGEDSVLLDRLHAAAPVAHLAGRGELFLYQFHGRNTFTKKHHVELAAYRRVSNEHLRRNASTLREALEYYALPTPLRVVGKEGIAFAFGAEERV